MRFIKNYVKRIIEKSKVELYNEMKRTKDTLIKNFKTDVRIEIHNQTKDMIEEMIEIKKKESLIELQEYLKEIDNEILKSRKKFEKTLDRKDKIFKKYEDAIKRIEGKKLISKAKKNKRIHDNYKKLREY